MINIQELRSLLELPKVSGLKVRNTGDLHIYEAKGPALAYCGLRLVTFIFISRLFLSFICCFSLVKKSVGIHCQEGAMISVLD